MIRLDNVVHAYATWTDDKKTMETALDGVSLDIPPGLFLGILGGNGSGKSTLARHLNGLLLPDSGTVWVDGRSTADVELLYEIRDRVGMVFQNPDNQIIGSSVEEDVAFGPEYRNRPSEWIRTKVAECLEAVGLSGRRRARPSRLSGGEKQRLAIAGVLAGAPSCIVLDEPTAMLDPVARREVIAIAHWLNSEKGVTVVLITHHTEELLDADSIIVMDRGRIRMQGTPAEVFSRRDLLEELRMDIPPVVELSDYLCERGIFSAGGYVDEDAFVEEAKRCYEQSR